MSKEPKHRDWIKIWIKESLVGTIREEMTSAERGFWYDILILAGNSRIPGTICSNKDAPLPLKRIAAILNVPEKFAQTCLEKFELTDRIRTERNGTITIVNWPKYQYSDYDRQKVYREKEAAFHEGKEITTYTPEMFEEDDAYIEELLLSEDAGKEKTFIYTCTCFQAKYGREKAVEYWPQYLLYLEQS